MISTLTEGIISELNNALRLKFPEGNPEVVFTNLTAPDRSISEKANNRIVASAVNMKLEQTPSASGFTRSVGLKPNDPRFIDLFLLFASCYWDDEYGKGLDYLSVIANYFQDKPVVTPQNTPNLPPSIAKITCEIVNPGFENLSFLWHAIGTSYLPSVICKIRIVQIGSDSILQEIPAVK